MIYVGRMKLMVAMMMAWVACGDTDDPITDPHELGECDANWNGGLDECEAACRSMPEQTGPNCTARLRSGTSVECSDGTFTIDGFSGCCAVLLTLRTARFAECV